MYLVFFYFFRFICRDNIRNGDRFAAFRLYFKGNSYGHPTEAVLSRLRDADVKVYRTDLQGDIIMKSDGDNITVTTAKNEDIQTNETAIEYDEGIYIGNKNSKKFHRPDCHTLPAEKNRVELSSREEAINNGYSPCGNCAP